MCGSALRFRPAFDNEFGAAPQKLGVAKIPEGSLAGRPKAFRTSDGIAADFLGNAFPNAKDFIHHFDRSADWHAGPH